MTLSAIPVEFQSPSTGLIKDTDVEAYLGGWLGSFFVNGFTPTAVNSSVQVVTGVAMLEGHWVQEGAATYVIPFVASGTYVWLQLNRTAGVGTPVTSAQYVAQATTPNDALVICSYVDNGHAVTSVTDLRQPAAIIKSLQGGAAGDIYYATLAGELRRLPIGSIGSVLQVGTSLYPIWAGGSVTPATDVITTSGTYTTPAGATRLIVTCVGGGGGGGGSAASAISGAGGGGAGQIVQTVILSPSSTYLVTIGTGGNGGTTTPGAGSTGSSTTFGSAITAIGGTGGGIPAATSGAGGQGSQSTWPTAGGGGAGGAGGVATTGNPGANDLYSAGGGSGAHTSGGGAGGNTETFSGGAGGTGANAGGGGGAGMFGQGGAGANQDNAGGSASANTGAGGGGSSVDTGGAMTGGNGGSGLVIVVAFFD